MSNNSAGQVARIAGDFYLVKYRDIEDDDFETYAQWGGVPVGWLLPGHNKAFADKHFFFIAEKSVRQELEDLKQLATLTPADTKEEQHFMTCNFCQQKFDMRDLQQVFEHEHNDLSTPQKNIGKLAPPAAQAVSEEELRKEARRYADRCRPMVFGVERMNVVDAYIAGAKSRSHISSTNVGDTAKNNQ